MAVMSIIDGLRNYIAECPLLAEIPVKARHVNWTAEPDANGNYGIFFASNEPIGEPYINGSQEKEYTVQINVRKISDNDVKRLEQSAWLERLQNWFAEQVRGGKLPEMPDDCVPTDIEAVNAGVLENSQTGKNSTYMVQIILTYTYYGKD